jgi:hypothetical protein
MEVYKPRPGKDVDLPLSAALGLSCCLLLEVVKEQIRRKESAEQEERVHGKCGVKNKL